MPNVFPSGESSWSVFILFYSFFTFSISLDEFFAYGRRKDGTYPPLEFEHVPFDHPLFIMFSSGTTGPPKCMVHSVGVRSFLRRGEKLFV